MKQWTIVVILFVLLALVGCTLPITTPTLEPTVTNTLEPTVQPTATFIATQTATSTETIGATVTNTFQLTSTLPSAKTYRYQAWYVLIIRDADGNDTGRRIQANEVVISYGPWPETVDTVWVELLDGNKIAYLNPTCDASGCVVVQYGAFLDPTYP